MQITHQMTIDMALQLPSAPIAAVQGDGNTRVLAVTLLENGAPWQIPENAVVDVAFRKPDGTKGIYSKLPDGSNATSRDGNVLSATLAPQMLTCPGPVLATVVFRTDGNKTLAAFPFTVKVEASPAAGAEISEDYFNPENLSDLRAEIAAGLATRATARTAVLQETNTAGWYRVGVVKQYSGCRITISTGYATRTDMCVALDAMTTFSNPALNKVSEAYTDPNVRVIDQVRLVKGSGEYFVDIHYNHNADNNVWVVMDGADGWFAPWESWVANPAGTASVTLAL